MGKIEGKHFSVTDPEGIYTVIYQINKTKREYLNKYPKYTIERLDCSEEFVNNLNRKTFYVEEPRKSGNELIMLSFGEDKVIINTALLKGNEVRISKKPSQFNFNTINPDETEYKEFLYTPNLKRAITIIDLDTKEEVKPKLFFDESKNEVRGKCRLKPYKSYFAFEVGEEK